jgi:hypothetical protein
MSCVVLKTCIDLIRKYKIRGSYGSEREDFHLLGYTAVKFGRWVTKFRRNVAADYSVRKMERAGSSETLNYISALP